MAFLEEATLMDPRFKGKLSSSDEVWERLKAAALREVSIYQNYIFKKKFAMFTTVYFYLYCNNVHSNINMLISLSDVRRGGCSASGGSGSGSGRG